jgi:hypothetical protein
MAAHEQHDQGVVLTRDVARGRLAEGRRAFAVPSRRFAAVLVDQPPLGGLEEPGARIRRDPVARPVRGGRE